ncbi:MAG: YHS domain-containing protein [Thaumarchaeota archaeon]|nr:YHS domain-containing protein [Nitrososphaerota archaeon]
MAIDPVCGMEVDEAQGLKSGVGGRKVYFCCSTCKSAFEEKPEEFLFDYS